MDRALLTLDTQVRHEERAFAAWGAQSAAWLEAPVQAPFGGPRAFDLGMPGPGPDRGFLEWGRQSAAFACGEGGACTSRQSAPGPRQGGRREAGADLAVPGSAFRGLSEEPFRVDLGGQEPIERNTSPQISDRSESGRQSEAVVREAGAPRRRVGSELMTPEPATQAPDAPFRIDLGARDPIELERHPLPSMRWRGQLLLTNEPRIDPHELPLMRDSCDVPWAPMSPPRTEPPDKHPGWNCPLPGAEDNLCDGPPETQCDRPCSVETFLNAPVDPGLPLVEQATPEEEEFVRAAWAALQQNLDVVRWAACVLEPFGGVAPGVGTYNFFADCLEKYLIGRSSTVVIVLKDQFSWPNYYLSLYVGFPSGFVNVNRSRAAWRETFGLYRDVESPAAELCGLMDFASSLLHELVHKCYPLAFALDIQYHCYNTYRIANMFRWAMAQRYPCIVAQPCCDKWDREYTWGNDTGNRLCG